MSAFSSPEKTRPNEDEGRYLNVAIKGFADRELYPIHAVLSHTEVNDVGAGGGYQGGGGYHGGGGGSGGGYPGGGGYCHFGCCGRRDYNGYCLRCCGIASDQVVDAQVETKPHN
ncbi:hypothetical protein KSS87_012458 [Heliosperma pusillum]|nr:hypothetical protein KSS87_012458 [Heliosperma pusillum]